MCTTVYSSLFLILSITLTISIMCGTKMATDGLPLHRQERGADPDILAGADFLSVFMGSTLRRAFRETTTEPSTTFYPSLETEATNQYIRTSRSTPEVTESTDQPEETTIVVQELEQKLDLENSSDSSLSDGVIVAVSVSSSVSRTLINKHISTNLNLQDLDVAQETSTGSHDQELVASEEHPSIIAEANKSEFHVEEKEPITRNSDLETSEFSRSYPASVHALPGPQHVAFSPPADFLRENTKDNPYHHTVIYHDRPGESGNARSVSYSTVIQSIPQPVHKWDNNEDKPKLNERHERNYNGESFRNKFDEDTDKKNNSKFEQQYFTTARPTRSTEKNWEKPEVNYEEQPTKKGITSERNWEVDEKRYSSSMTPLPKIYGQPEQNYEVDEAISVVTNGRTHGVQPSQSPVPTKIETKDRETKKDGNQKVGYVVEGKNYRKYRLEERTPDGFIVGEYGVVNHDDGSLRGVRYTADGTISRRLIHDALMKFLSL